MSLTYGFYNSANSDRLYNATQMSAIFDGIITDGIFAAIGTSLVVAASSGMVVNVGVGRAWFNSTWTDNDALLPLALDGADVVLDRFDVVVLEVNAAISSRVNSIKIVKGTAGSEPVYPTLVETDEVHQHPLAYISVKGGATAINQVDIINMVGSAITPFITGIIDTISIEGLSTLFTSEFESWFATVQNTLDGDAAGNLLNLINKLIIVDEDEPVDPTAQQVWCDVVSNSNILM